MPHDASVFVGRYLFRSRTYQVSFINCHSSLPTTVDQAELTRLLSEHLSEHTEVKNIKVVRDAKGGVCAFVQCEVRNFQNFPCVYYTNFQINRTLFRRPR